MSDSLQAHKSQDIVAIKCYRNGKKTTWIETKCGATITISTNDRFLASILMCLFVIQCYRCFHRLHQTKTEIECELKTARKRTTIILLDIYEMNMLL